MQMLFQFNKGRVLATEANFYNHIDQLKCTSSYLHITFTRFQDYPQTLCNSSQLKSDFSNFSLHRK